MGIEIERKFLILGDDWRRQVEKTVKLRDGLVAVSAQAKVRVRVCDDKASITVKSHATGAVRSEYEYSIAVTDAAEMIETLCGDMVIEKQRHHITYEGFHWTVDEYFGVLAGVIIAEIELDKVEVAPPLPGWIGEEVTGNARYKKRNMLLERLS